MMARPESRRNDDDNEDATRPFVATLSVVSFRVSSSQYGQRDKLPFRTRSCSSPGYREPSTRLPGSFHLEAPRRRWKPTAKTRASGKSRYKGKHPEGDFRDVNSQTVLSSSHTHACQLEVLVRALASVAIAPGNIPGRGTTRENAASESTSRSLRSLSRLSVSPSPTYSKSDSFRVLGAYSCTRGGSRFYGLESRSRLLDEWATFSATL